MTRWPAARLAAGALAVALLVAPRVSGFVAPRLSQRFHAGPRAALAQQPRPASVPGAPGRGVPGATQRELEKLENDWAQAVIRRDAAAIRRLVAPGWVYSDESGIMDRDAGIRAFTTGPDTVTTAGNEEMRVHAYGGTAIVTGILWMRGRGPKGPFLHRYRYTDTWMKLDGRWQCVASQDYLMPAGGVAK